VKVRITVGEVDLRAEGIDLTKRDITRLLTRASVIAATLAAVQAADEEPKPPFGFSAQVERLPEEIPQEDLSWYFDE
jgi:hypothetical protein